MFLLEVITCVTDKSSVLKVFLTPITHYLLLLYSLPTVLFISRIYPSMYVPDLDRAYVLYVHTAYRVDIRAGASILGH